MRSRVFRVGDDPLLCQFGEIGVLAVVDRIAGDDPAQRMAGQFQTAHAFVAYQVGLQDQIEKAFLQLIAEIERCIRHQLDFNSRIQLGHLRHQRAQPGVNHRVHDTDTHTADFARTGLDRLLQCLHGVEHLLGIVQHFQAFGRQAHATRITQKQLHTEFAFKHRDAAGNRRLGGEQLVGGQTKTLQPGDPDKGLEKLQVHGQGSGDKFFLCLRRVFIRWTQQGYGTKNRRIRIPR